MRFLSADYLYPLHIPPIKKGVLQVSKLGEVISIFNDRSKIPKHKLEIFDGILSPGFVNAHCHLELSHLLNKNQKKTGLTKFISNISRQRIEDLEIKKKAILKADKMMKRNGIVGVGDISNTEDSFFIKNTSEIIYHTFIELFSLDDKSAEKIYKSGLELLRLCPGNASITPHATYSASKSLYSKIKLNNTGEVLSLHNQESASENNLFVKGEGNLKEFLKNYGTVNVTGQSALISALLKLPKRTPIILVHNIYTSVNDIKWIIQNNYNTFFCTCPKANLFIEGRLPDYSIFDTNKLCVGTDSLAANDNLSVLEELKIIKKNTDFSIETLLKMGCKNGAEALSMNYLGTFEEGKKPGVNLINNFENLRVIY